MQKQHSWPQATGEEQGGTKTSRSVCVDGTKKAAINMCDVEILSPRTAVESPRLETSYKARYFLQELVKTKYKGQRQREGLLDLNSSGGHKHYT